MYTVKKIETPERGEQFAVVIGENIINRWLTEEEAKENATELNGGEKAEKKLEAAEKKAEEDAKKAAEADQKSRASAAKEAKSHPDDHPARSRAQPAKAKVHFVKRMAPKPTRRHK